MNTTDGKSRYHIIDSLLNTENIRVFVETSYLLKHTEKVDTILLICVPNTENNRVIWVS